MPRVGGGREYNAAMAERVVCDICRGVLPSHASYVVKIEVFADPSVPGVSAEELAEADFEGTMAALIEEMMGMSAEDLQDQVHRAFEFRICRGCHARFLVNPLGLPRVRGAAEGRGN